MTNATLLVRFRRHAPGLACGTAGVAAAWAVHLLLPPVALLTAAVLLGVVVANLGLVPPATRPGLGFASRRLMRAGVVLLGLQVSLADIAGLGWRTVAVVLGIVMTTFFGTRWLGRRLGLSDHLALLVASGFAICGASAIAAVNGAVGHSREDDEDTVTAVALVALCGSMAIVVLPFAGHVLGMSPVTFGRWAGASVHDVGQVVATASIVGPAALAPAMAVKLIRVATLAPVAAGVGAAHRRRVRAARAAEPRAARAVVLQPVAANAPAAGSFRTAPSETHHPAGPGRRPPVLPAFVAGFTLLIIVRTTGRVPGAVLDLAQTGQNLLFAAALFALGTFVRVWGLLGSGRRALGLGFASWALIAVVSYLGVLAS